MDPILNKRNIAALDAAATADRAAAGKLADRVVAMEAALATQANRIASLEARIGLLMARLGGGPTSL